MARTISVRVLTPKGLAISDEAVSIQAPGGLGYLGILYSHAPMVSTVQPGKLSWKRPDGQPRILQVGEGIMEISKNRFTLLTNAVSMDGGA